MNLSLTGIKGKILKNADWAAYLAAVWERFDGDTGAIMDYYISLGPLHYGKLTLSNLSHYKYKFTTGAHLYGTLIKGSIIAYILAEIGIVPSKYKIPAKKALIGSAIAALTLPGGGAHLSSGSKTSGGGHSPSWGYNP